MLVERIVGLERARGSKTEGWMKGGTVVNWSSSRRLNAYTWCWLGTRVLWYWWYGVPGDQLQAGSGMGGKVRPAFAATLNCNPVLLTDFSYRFALFCAVPLSKQISCNVSIIESSGVFTSMWLEDSVLRYGTVFQCKPFLTFRNSVLPSSFRWGTYLRITQWRTYISLKNGILVSSIAGLFHGCFTLTVPR